MHKIILGVTLLAGVAIAGGILAKKAMSAKAKETNEPCDGDCLNCTRTDCTDTDEDKISSAKSACFSPEEWVEKIKQHTAEINAKSEEFAKSAREHGDDFAQKFANVIRDFNASIRNNFGTNATETYSDDATAEEMSEAYASEPSSIDPNYVRDRCADADDSDADDVFGQTANFGGVFTEAADTGCSCHCENCDGIEACTERIEHLDNCDTEEFEDHLDDEIESDDDEFVEEDKLDDSDSNFDAEPVDDFGEFDNDDSLLSADPNDAVPVSNAEPIPMKPDDFDDDAVITKPNDDDIALASAVSAAESERRSWVEDENSEFLKDTECTEDTGEQL